MMLPSPPLSVCVCLCVRRDATARRISLGGEGNALYPVLSSYFLFQLKGFKLIYNASIA